MHIYKCFEGEFVRLVCSGGRAGWVGFGRFDVCFVGVWCLSRDPESRQVGGGDVAFLPALAVAAIVGICEISQLRLVDFQFPLDALVSSTLNILLDSDPSILATHYPPAAGSHAQPSLHFLELLHGSRLGLRIFNLLLLAVFQFPLLSFLFQAFRFLVLREQVAQSALSAEQVAVART